MLKNSLVLLATVLQQEYVYRIIDLADLIQHITIAELEQESALS